MQTNASELEELEQQIHAELNCQKLCLDIIEQIVNNKLFFLLPCNIWETYKSHHQKRQKILKSIKEKNNKKELTRDYVINTLLPILKDNRNYLIDYLKDLFATANITLNSNYQNLSNIIRTLSQNFASLKKLLHNREKPSLSFNEIEEIFSTLISKLTTEIENIRKKLPQNFDKKFLQEKLQNVFNRALEIQHQIYIYQIRLKKISGLEPSHLESKFIPTSEILPKEAYQDLILLAHICHPRGALDSLRREFAFFENLYSSFKENITALRKKLSNHFTEFIRLQRIILAHQDWLNKLTQLEQSKFAINGNLTDLVTLIELLNPYKRKVLRKFFDEHIANHVIEKLITFVNDYSSCNIDQLNKELLKQKDQLLLNIKIKQQTLVQHQTWQQRMLASLLFSIQQQLLYQYHKSLTQFTEYGTDKITQAVQQLPVPTTLRHRIKKLSEKEIPVVLQKPAIWLRDNIDLDSSFNLGFFSSSLLVAKWRGYTSQIIYTLTQTLLTLADLNLRTWFDEKFLYTIDKLIQSIISPLLKNIRTLTPQSLSSFLEWLENAIRLDEVGVLKKDPFSIIKWCCGLAIFLYCIESPLIVGTFGYISIDIFSRGFAKVFELIAKKSDYDPRLLGFLFMATYFFIFYYLGYPSQLGFKLSNWLFPPKIKGLSYAGALSKLGLLASDKPTEKAIRKAFHNQMLLFHPDKCQGNYCITAEPKTIELNAAYQIAMKKNL